MNYPLLRRYLLKAAVETNDPATQNHMVQLLGHLSPDSQVQRGEDDEVMDPDLSKGLPSQNKKPKGVEDLILQKAMPELVKEDSNDSGVFGKVDAPTIQKTSLWHAMCRTAPLRLKVAAYIKDTLVSELPEKVREEIRRFIPKTPKDPLVIHYGMIVRELLDRVDTQNFKSAVATVNAELGGLSKAALAKSKDELYAKLKEKYILLVNDKIVDGHHFLAKAKYFGVSSSINVVDLTPARFQS